ncbi:protease inhibitor I42 family protein [Chloroflexota bacterium]
MKRLFLVLSVLPVLFTIACDDDDNKLPELVGVGASCDEFKESQHISNEVKVPVESELTVILCSNPSTGFEWESAETSDTTVLKQTHHEYAAPGQVKIPPPPGTDGHEIWNFMALEAGESTISLTYSQPWDDGLKDDWTFELKVTVE